MKTPIVFILFCLSVSVLAEAEDCPIDNCQIAESCRCSSIENPITDADNPAPQLVAITVSEEITSTIYKEYWDDLFVSGNRNNSDDSPIGVTFYVSHENTDYHVVNALYLQGHEIGSYSITKNADTDYWDNASVDDLRKEFVGQQKVISKFANIPVESITGVRTPLLELDGDRSLEAYGSDFSYDNSWPTPSTSHLLPYSLDFHSIQADDCTLHSCPMEAYPKFWIAPVTNINGPDGNECNFISTCNVEDKSADGIADWLFSEVDAVRQDNRAPVTLLLESKWFRSVENSYDGFTKFLDKIRDDSGKDIFLVTVQDVLQWMKDPKGFKDYTRPDSGDTSSVCLNVICPLDSKFMVSCVSCPAHYPSLDNPEGN